MGGVGEVHPCLNSRKSWGEMQAYSFRDLPYRFLDGFANVFQRVLSNRFVHSLSTIVVFPICQVVGLQQGQKTFI